MITHRVFRSTVTNEFKRCRMRLGDNLRSPCVLQLHHAGVTMKVNLGFEPKAQLKKANELIEKQGYCRSKELEDAEASAVTWEGLAS